MNDFDQVIFPPDTDAFEGLKIVKCQTFLKGFFLLTQISREEASVP